MSLEERIHDISNISAALGLLTKSEQNSFIPVKLGLKPYSIKQSEYAEIGQVSNIWQKLLYLASKDLQLIKRTFQPVVEVDDLIKRIYSIFLKSCQSPSQDSFMLTRVDYFKNTDNEFKIIQYNLTAVSMHAHVENYQKTHQLIDFKSQQNLQISYPHNTPCSDIADSVAEMYKLKGLNGIFLMIVSIKEKNVIDQANIQLKLLEKGIKTIRYSLCKLHSKLQKKQNKIFFDGQEVSMVYYRAGYHPRDYCQTGNIQQCWKVRQTIELSNAIKIPDIKMELMNQKRMQVELSKHNVHSKYLTPEESQILKKSLVFITDFEQNGSEIDYLKFLQQKGVEKFILKPNLQGGGNNIHGKKVYETLQNISKEERQKYIMMQRIDTNSVENTIIFGKEYTTLDCICEISRYGVLMEVDGKLIKNTSDGYLVRIKPQTFNEGGVIAGFGAIAVVTFKK